MRSDTPYKKAASYEAEIGDVSNVLLLYSGGLDTSVMLKWIQDEYGAEVIALTVDLGQQVDDLDAIKEKALRLGAKKAIVLDAKSEFADEYIVKGIKANASYQGEYHLSTPMGRALLAKKAVEIAESEGADCIAHGCTGKGNDQVRIEGYALALNPSIKIIAPVREWAMDRDEEIRYAAKHDIEVPASVDFPYSVDDNMWGMTWEGGEIEEPDVISPTGVFLTTYTDPHNAPGKTELVRLTFEQGVPIALNDQQLPLASIVTQLNKIAGAHGVGIVHVFEDRLVGVKNGGVYELPAAHVIIEAHRALERYVSTRQLNELKAQLDLKWGYLCYGAMWYDQSMEAINAFNEFVNQRVSGRVTVALYRGNADVVSMESPYGLDHSSFSNGDGYSLNVNAAAGFIEIYSLQMRLAKQAAERAERGSAES